MLSTVPTRTFLLLASTFLCVQRHERKNSKRQMREGGGGGGNAKALGMNKIGDVEYFALGSSGHFTRHFNP